MDSRAHKRISTAPPPITGVNPPAVEIPYLQLSDEDPIANNPYPSSDDRHALWEQLTEEARAAVYQFRAAMSERYRQSPPVSYRAWTEALITAWFSAWGQRNARMVSSSEDLEAFDRWLTTYSRLWFDKVIDSWEGHFRSWVMPDLAQVLGEQVDHWKAEGRRVLGEVDTIRRTKAQPSPGQRDSTYATATPTGPAAESLAKSEARSLQDKRLVYVAPETDAETREQVARLRRDAIDGYIAQHQQKYSERIRRVDIWRAAGYKDPTSFEDWQACRVDASRGAGEAFMRVLCEPRLKTKKAPK